MIKKFSTLFLLLLFACTSKPKVEKSAQQTFYDTHLLFDLEEESERSPCPIQGKIPEWLSGVLLRNGPGKFTVGDKRVDWFDGLALLHAFEFTPQNVFYSSRFLRSEQYYIMNEEKSLNFAGFAVDPCPKTFKNQTSRFIPKEMKDIVNADVTIQQYADQFVALTEIPLPVVFDPETLATIGNFQYQDDLKQGQVESAHPQHDLASKETVNYFIRFGRKSSYVIWKMKDGESKREVIAEIPVDEPAYMHSFALTEHYVVLAEYPFVVSPLSLIINKKPYIMNFKWKPERGTTFTVVERATGKVTKIKGEPFFAFHHINAFDKDGKLFLDIVTYKNAEIISEVDGEKEWNSNELASQMALKRFTIELAGETLSEEILFDQPLELPRVPADRVAHEYRYCYLVDYDFATSLKDQRSLYKVDVTKKRGISWSEEGCMPGEPIFVPRPGASEEDDGVVLSLVLDFAKHRSFLVILNARDMKELARAGVPYAIPLGLHGLWKGPK
jgi:carotenoid cleavage dioxygenase-like enzyme